MANLADLVATLTIDATAYRSGLDDAAKATEDFTSTADAQLAGLAAGGVAALGAAMGVVAGVAVDFASQTSQSINDLQAELGLTSSEAEEMGQVVKDVFGNNFGDSIGDVKSAVSTLHSTFDGLGVDISDNLQGVTEDAFRLRDVFGVDISESANAAAALMRDFGLTSDEAFDFITSGFQGGLNASGDFLESITEYSTQFQNGGASADQFFSLLNSGMGSGMLGTDKAADAFKEFVVRIQDGSTATAEGLKMLGINSDELTAQMASGQVTAADAFNLVLGKLRETDDLNLRMQAGVALLGTQFEDLGADAALALDMTNTKLVDLAGSTDTLDVKYNNLGSAFESVKRRGLLALEPLGVILLDLANTAVPHVIGAIDLLSEKTPMAFSWLLANGPKVAPILLGIGAAILAAVVPPFIAWAGAAITAGAATIAAMLPVLIPIALIGLAVGVLSAAWLGNWGNIQGHTATAVSFITTHFERAKIGYEFLKAGIQDLAANTVKGWNYLKDGTVSNINTVVSTVTSSFENIRNTVTTKIEEAKARVLSTFDNIRTGIDNLTGGMASSALGIARAIVEGLVNGIKSGVGSVVSAISGMVKSALDQAKKLLGIQSPSKAFAYLGDMSVTGFIGPFIEDGVYLAGKAGSTMAGAALQGARSTPMPNVSGAGSSVSIVVETIDARGSNLTEREYRQITRDVVGELVAESYGRSLALN